jgi:hypothetical protein
MQESFELLHTRLNTDVPAETRLGFIAKQRSFHILLRRRQVLLSNYLL